MSKINELKLLTKIGLQTFTDKAYFHLFTEFYNDYFMEFKDKEINILEIGILNGASIRMLACFFEKAQIYGIDINEKSINDIKYPVFQNRIKTYLCSQVDFDKIDVLFKNIKFDIIIDDGSHLTSHQRKTLGHMFKYLNKGGIYVCEDLHAYTKGYNDVNVSTLDIFNEYNKTEIYNCDLITEYQQKYLNDNIDLLKIFYRDKNAFMCYKCKKINKFIKETCSCGTILDCVNDQSITSILIHK
jgi:23S rRNA U2552 (ribose-2'-O)-methylase RlmE/FtsJ